MENIPNENKALAPSEPNSIVALLDGLTPQNRLFLSYLLQGQKVKDAYRLAGYDGASDDAAYVLKHRLDRELNALAKALGTSNADIRLSAHGLLSLPTVDKEGQAVSGITINQRIKLLELTAKVNAAEAKAAMPEAPKLTFISIRPPLAVAASNDTKAQEPIDTTIIDGTQS